MVSMVGGIFVSMAVFAIAKHSSSFSMQQSRIADATLQNVVGFERLRADISRAGFLSTPNMVDDPRLCRTAVYPLWLRRLASVFIEPVPPPLSPEMTVNGLAPSRIVLGGSYASANEFLIRRVDPAAKAQVVLQANSLGMVEMGFKANPTAETLERVFAAGRALRIVDRSGRAQYGEIDSVSIGTEGEPIVTLAESPALTFAGENQPCGLAGFGTQGTANVVNIIRYDLRNLDDPAFPQYAPMFVGGPSYEKGNRRELIREELDLAGEPFPGSLELVAEYAVDLGFSLFVARTQTQPLTRLLPAEVSNFAGTPGTLATGQGPQRIRAVQAWLSTRSQEADRPVGLELTTTAPGPELLRVSLHPTDRTQPPFARVRTVQSMVPSTIKQRCPGDEERSSPALATAARQRGMAVFLVVMVLTMVTAIGIFSMRSASLVDLASGFNRQNIQATLIAEYGARSAATWLGPNKEQVMASDLRACNQPLLDADPDARCVLLKDTMLTQAFTDSAPLGFNDGLMGLLSLPTGSGQQLRAEVVSEMTEIGDASSARAGSPAGGVRELTVTTKARVYPTATGSTAICSPGARGVLSQQVLRAHVIVQM